MQIIAWQKEESKAEKLKWRSRSSVEDKRHEIFLLHSVAQKVAQRNLMQLMRFKRMQTVRRRVYVYMCVRDCLLSRSLNHRHTAGATWAAHWGHSWASPTVVSVFSLCANVVECDYKCHLHFNWWATPPSPRSAPGKHLRQLKSAQNEVAAAVWKVLEAAAWSCCTLHTLHV